MQACIFGIPLNQFGGIQNSGNTIQGLSINSTTFLGVGQTHSGQLYLVLNKDIIKR